MLYLLLFSLFIGGNNMNHQYTIFESDQIVSNHVNSRYFHPQLVQENPELFIITTQEEDYLKAAMYIYCKDENVYIRTQGVFYLYNSQKIDFSGMPVRFINSNDCFQFADGTKLCPSLPPDVHKVGTSERWFEMRWRRVYNNYYLITLFRGEKQAVEEVLMTEQNGKDLAPILGESSKERDLRGYFASMGGWRDKYISKLERVNGELQRTVYNLIPVREKDLPPDFPKGLVRWIP